MKYEVLEKFQDSDGQVYEAGHPYPSKGKLKKERVEALSTSNNRCGRPFIQEAKDGEQDKEDLENAEAGTEENAEDRQEAKEDEQEPEEGK